MMFKNYVAGKRVNQVYLPGGLYITENHTNREYSIAGWV